MNTIVSSGHTPRTREAIKTAFRLAINRSKSRTEARRIDRLRGRFFAGKLSPTDALIAWMDLRIDVKDAGNSNVRAP